MFRFTKDHNLQYQHSQNFSFASFLQIYSDIYYTENREFNTFHYNYPVRKTRMGTA